MARVLSLLFLLVAALLVLAWFFRSGDLHNALPAPADSSTSNIASSTWREYVAPFGQFKVLMPSRPHHATDLVNVPDSKEVRKYEIYLANKDDGTLYSINLITFPEDNKEKFDDIFLQKVVTELLTSNANNTIRNMKMVPFRDGKAIEFSVDTANTALNGKAFLQGKTLYVLSTTSVNKDNLNPQEFDFFINSFQLGPEVKETKIPASNT